MIDVEVRVCGIPAIARVTYYYRQEPHKGSAHTCDSDWDYYGYTEVEYEICDRRGRYAPWLERKITNKVHEEIVSEISESISN